ncbi:helix-turn-helix domain-containing protein [Vibrio sp. S4M6]|uniref:helix-turn-helix domain-containing protein n=1 Tax=Vibrio sinus TaxID=2946865 RepID=UPI00202A3E6B|nr:XRE family transcriptional regulator [Vibrio sinus]MCL9783638.1 helix-turn-helix domain-containing protein [Vibrio sinus]
MGDRIKMRREELKLSKTELAQAAECSITMVSKWEKGMTMGIEFAARLCEKLDVSLNWLYYGIGDSSSNCVTTKIPIVGNTQAGPDKEWFNLDYPSGFGDSYIDFPAEGRNVYALKVVGDSMSPRILEGEAVIVDPESEPATGEEVIVRLQDGDVMVKTLAAMRDGQIFLDSFNNGYSRMTFPLSDVATIHPVIGVARSSKIKTI